MELDETSNDSTISYLSDCDNESCFLYCTDFIEPPKFEELQPKINNIISSVNLGCALNLKNISQKFKNAEYNINKTSTIILKSKNSKIIGTLFSDGKMICSGGKTAKEAKIACNKFCKIVKKLGYKVELKDFKIQNIIISYDVQFKILLRELYNKLSNLLNNNYVKYNNEMFPSVIIYIDEYKIYITIFESGKVILSGGKKRKDIEDVFRNIYPILIESKATTEKEDKQ